jgi:hypothetical protein
LRVPGYFWRAALGAAVAAVASALLVGAMFFLMFGFDPTAFLTSVRVLQVSGPAAFLVGLPLYLLVRHVASGLPGLIPVGAVAGIVMTALSGEGASDAFLYLYAAVLGGLSAVCAYPIVVPRTRVTQGAG